MRKLLFRAMRKDNKEWIYGLPVYGTFSEEPKITHIATVMNEHGSPFEIIPETLCQFIGRFDKFDHPIFECDAIRTQYGRLCLVVWFDSPNDIGWDLKPIEDKHPYPDAELWNSQYLEVVGNIFDGWKEE